MKKFILEFTVFIGGAVVMVYELAGSRVLAPYLGTSLVTWTNLIGIILGSLSLGYFFGGKLADQNPKRKILSLILLLAAMLILFTAIYKDTILALILFGIRDIHLSGIITTIILFAPASIFLGMISPYAIRLKIDAVENSGVTVGGMYAISTIGSIVGTFLAGFYLVPTIGTTNILFLLVVVLMVNSILMNFHNFLKVRLSVIILVIFFCVLGPFSDAHNLDNLVDIDTQYNRAWVYDTVDHKTKRPVRHLRIDPRGVQGAVYLDQDDDLVFEYLKFYRLSKHFFPNPQRALFIGGGVFRYPRDFAEKNPDAYLDVVEIDSGLTKIAQKYFNFQDHPRIAVHHEDGRTFVNNQKEKYDIVFVDAFNSRSAIPFQLTTSEFVEKLHTNLEDDGIVLINLISGLAGENGKFFRSEYKTYQEIFSQISVFPVLDKDDTTKVQNIIMIAHKGNKDLIFESHDEELAGYLDNRFTKEVDMEIPTLRDDYAPVDYYVLSFSK